MTPPKVELEPKPASSSKISNTLGAPLGGTTRAGQAGFDCMAFSSISPWNGCDRGGRWRPSIVVVASGEPGVPVVCCCAVAGVTRASVAAEVDVKGSRLFMTALLWKIRPVQSGCRETFTNLVNAMQHLALAITHTYFL